MCRWSRAVYALSRCVYRECDAALARFFLSRVEYATRSASGRCRQDADRGGERVNSLFSPDHNDDARPKEPRRVRAVERRFDTERCANIVSLTHSADLRSGKITRRI